MYGAIFSFSTIIDGLLGKPGATMYAGEDKVKEHRGIARVDGGSRVQARIGTATGPL